MKSRKIITIVALEGEGTPWPTMPLYFDRLILKRRGWTLSLIRRLLSSSEFRVPVGNGYYYKDRCCYPTGDVLRAERSPWFKVRLEQRSQKRKPRLVFIPSRVRSSGGNHDHAH